MDSNDHIKAMLKQTALTDDLLAEIGRVTVHFSLLERDLEELAHFLLGLPMEAAKCITSELSFRGLQALVSSLVGQLAPEKSELLHKILKKVARAEDLRNQVSHSLWGLSLNSTRDEIIAVRTKYTAKQKAGLKFSKEEMGVPEIREISDAVSVAAYEVESFHKLLRSQAANNSLQGRRP